MAIVKMKKISIVVLNSERKESVKALRKMGLVHLEAIEGKGAVLSAYKESSATLEKALSILDEIKVQKKNVPVQVQIGSDAVLEKAKEIVALSDKKKSLYDFIAQSEQEKERLALWGDVYPEDFAFLVQKGIFIYMYEIPMDKYALIGQNVKTIQVNSTNKITRFLVISETELTERPAELPPEAYSVPLPENSTERISLDIENAKKEIARIDEDLLSDKKYHDSLVAFKKVLATDIEFESVYSGMEHDGAEEATSEENDSAALAWISGFVPVDSLDEFIVTCKEHEWAFAMADPKEEDSVPTKLHNNKFVSLIYPLTDFLDVTPGYNEFDISGWFLLFFCIFFAMIFADTGYGAIIAIAGLILLAKSKKGKRSLSVLVTLLGLSTMLWGVLTCSWFGIDSSLLPEWMVDISFAPVSAAKIGKDAADKNQQVFCFMLAIIQLSIAHIKCLIADKKSLKWVGDLGSLLQLWGMFYVVMSMVVDSVNYPLVANGKSIPAFGGYLPSFTPTIAIIVLAIGFVMSFIFSNYNGSIKESVLESCKNIISVLLGIVNVFSDIVSYIRLWAVALAGAAISSTVNTMAGPMLGKLILVIFGIVLLLFGHGLNMILNVLSVIVHGVRLNTLEFSQHLGMTWSGIKYNPFRENH